MIGFEFTLVLDALIPGLSLVEPAGGFGRALEL